MSEQQLILISIGPVQGFIAAARRLRDLWFGSWILSQLAKRASRFLQTEGAELIFPGIDDPKMLEEAGESAIANKIMAILPPGRDGRMVFENLRSDLVGYWRQKGKETINDKVDRRLFEAQIDDFLEVHGAWLRSSGDYPEDRKRLEALLSARKAAREFDQPAWMVGAAGGLPKSSLDGARESVMTPAARQQANKTRTGVLKEYEELDAVGWMKRNGKKNVGTDVEENPYFDHLADVACQPYLARVLGDPTAAGHLKKAADAILADAPLKELFPKARNRDDKQRVLRYLPAQIVFTELTSRLLQDRQLDGTVNGIQLIGALRKMARTVDQAVGRHLEPTPYVAVLLGDGDRMGAAIGRMKDPQAHRQFSIQLDRFARAMQPLVEERHQGNLIYAGGDDVLAVVPVERALICCREIRDTFLRQLKPVAPEATFSIGLAIVHMIEPMDQALETARRAEKFAKNQGGRDALAVILDKRSGSPLTVTGKWEGPIGSGGDQQGLYDRLLTGIDLFDQQKLPSRFAYQLRLLIRQLGDMEPKPEIRKGDAEQNIDRRNRMRREELVRILDRKTDRAGQTLDPGDKKWLQEQRDSIRQLSDELVLSHFFSSNRLYDEPSSSSPQKESA